MVRAGTNPSAPVSSSLTNRPARVAPEMWPSKVAPMRSAGKWARRRAEVSRSAFIAGRLAGGVDVGAERAECGGVLLLRQSAITEPQGADEAAMNDEVGITADRRGEMGVAAQVETEMPVVLGGIFGLRLGAQHHLVDKLFDV